MWAFLKELATTIGALFTGGLLGMFKQQNNELESQLNDVNEYARNHAKNVALSDSELDSKL